MADPWRLKFLPLESMKLIKTFPQSFVFDPTLFRLSGSFVNVFADDITLYHATWRHFTHLDIASCLPTDLNLMVKWTRKWSASFNNSTVLRRISIEKRPTALINSKGSNLFLIGRGTLCIPWITNCTTKMTCSSIGLRIVSTTWCFVVRILKKVIMNTVQIFGQFPPGITSFFLHSTCILSRRKELLWTKFIIIKKKQNGYSLKYTDCIPAEE